MRVALTIDSSISCAVAGQENTGSLEGSLEGAAEPAGQHPALRSLLANLNDAGSPFSTFGCKVWSTGSESTGEENAAASCVFASRVGIFFRREADRSAAKSLIGVAHRLAELLHQEGDSLSVEMLLARAEFLEGRSGYCLQLSLSAKGNSPGQARMRWGLGMARMQQALLFVARELTRE